MTSVPEYYTRFFNQVSEAIEELQANNYGSALRILIDAQFEAEELYLKSGDHGE